MALPYLNSVTEFCDDTEDNLHDKELPNKHNLYCDGRSTWEVILSRSDLAHNSSRAPEPSFLTVRSSIRDVMYVLLMDMSSSMLAGTSKGKLKTY